MIETGALAESKNRALRFLEDVLITFGATESTSLFSDSPIRITVWRGFAEDPNKKQTLLIELNNFIRAQTALDGLHRFLEENAPDDIVPRMRAMGEIVLVSADMDDMIRAVFPCTFWFREFDPDKVDLWHRSVIQAAGAESLAELRRIIAQSELIMLWRFLVAWIAIRNAQAAVERMREILAETGEDLGVGAEDPTNAALETARWGSITRDCQALLNVTSPELLDSHNAAFAEQTFQEVRRFLRDLLEEYGTPLGYLVWLQRELGPALQAPIWSIDLSRAGDLATARSRQTVKIDAAENVFRTSAREITWAVLDSGIDALHPAFRDRAAEKAAQSTPKSKKKEKDAPDDLALSRVVATYDFNRLRYLFEENWDLLLPEDQRTLPDGSVATTPDDILLLLFGMYQSRDEKRLSSSDLMARLADDDFRKEVVFYTGEVKERITRGETLDWPLLERILRVPHVTGIYQPPKNGHGTHVAGILGGCVPRNSLPEFGGPDNDISGMCPDIRLYDLRVCDENGQSDEFLVMAALQFIAYLNRTRDRLIVQGANLSIQIRHQVRSYGCGQTPVCREANRLVDSGVCVVVAAGNKGFNTLQGTSELVDAYAWSSIMDPGNADKVITVGSTHRISPHSFGISYFSSRGPTADGRAKPDLVAPGEKIVAPALNNSLRPDTGTSMAAPHVSGAAALIMARHSEFIGHPQKVKDILCRSATDLGRRRDFQGAGLVDVLRALESI